MKISAIIPTLNEARIISHAVDRAWLSGADEVIVVDGGSDDGTAEIVGQQNCVLVQSVPGRGQQLNAGAASATGDVFLFLHADTLLAESSCDQIRDLFSDETKDCGAFRQSISSSRHVFRWIAWGNALRVRWFGLAYGDQGIFVRRRLFDSVGGFDEIALMEDFQFSQKIRKTSRYSLLPGPLSVDPRRWQKNGPIRQTLTNWSIALAYLRGADPQDLADRYNRKK